MRLFFSTLSTPPSARQRRLFVTAACLAALTACAESPQQYEPPPSRAVEWVKVQPYSGEQPASVVGQLQAVDQATLSFEVSGAIEFIAVRIGDSFSKNQVLARLDTRVYELEQQRRAATLKQAQAELAFAEVDYRRKASLAGTGAIADADIDAARSRRDSASSQVAALRSALQQANKSRNDVELRAPYAGILNKRLAEPGQVVMPGQAVLAVAEKSHEIELAVHVTAAQLAGLTEGDEFMVNIDTVSEAQRATLTDIGHIADSTLAFPLRFVLLNTGFLRPGMSAELLIPRRHDVDKGEDLAKGLVLVPHTAVQTGVTGERYVMAIDKKNYAVRHPVVVKRIVDNGYVLSHALPPASRIVSRGAFQVRAGEQLTLIDAAIRRFPQ